MKISRTWSLFATITLSIAISGCGGESQTTDEPKQGDEQAQAAPGDEQLEPAAAAVAAFLEASKNGDDEGTAAMLTRQARETAAKMDLAVGASASDTATFEVGDIQYAGEDIARVACLWKDQGRSSDAVWVVRKTDDGWRIAGVAFTVFENEPPLLLNFENPEEMIRKRQWLAEEIARRAAGSRDTDPDSGRNVAETPGNPVRR